MQQSKTLPITELIGWMNNWQRVVAEQEKKTKINYNFSFPLQDPVLFSIDRKMRKKNLDHIQTWLPLDILHVCVLFIYSIPRKPTVKQVIWIIINFINNATK